MTELTLVLCIVGAVVVSSFLSRFIPKISTPLVQIVLGDAAAQLPFFPDVTLDPDPDEGLPSEANGERVGDGDDLDHTGVHEPLDALADGERVVIGAVILCLAVGALTIWWIGRRVARPLSALGQAMGRLASGDLAIEVPFRHRVDEVGTGCQCPA